MTSGAGYCSNMFLSIWVVYGLFSVFSNLITTCKHLLFRCLLLNSYGSLFHRVIMHSPLILRMLTSTFLLSHIIVTFCDLFNRINLTSGRLCCLGLLQAPKVFTSHTKSILFLCHHKGFCINIYLDDILVLVHSKHASKWTQSFLCSILEHLG